MPSASWSLQGYDRELIHGREAGSSRWPQCHYPRGAYLPQPSLAIQTVRACLKQPSPFVLQPHLTYIPKLAAPLLPSLPACTPKPHFPQTLTFLWSQAAYIHVHTLGNLGQVHLSKPQFPHL